MNTDIGVDIFFLCFQPQHLKVDLCELEAFKAALGYRSPCLKKKEEGRDGGKRGRKEN